MKPATAGLWLGVTYLVTLVVCVVAALCGHLGDVMIVVIPGFSLAISIRLGIINHGEEEPDTAGYLLVAAWFIVMWIGWLQYQYELIKW